MIELKLNKESELSFEINVEGSKEPPKARLIFEVDSNMELALKGKIQEGNVKVSVPSLMDLKEKLSGENVKGYLEVIVDNNYFVPWEEHFSLKAPITVQAESASAPVKQSEIKISLGKKNLVEKNEIVELKADFRIPKTNVLLEAGDKFEILSSGDEKYGAGIKIMESFTIPGTTSTISKQNRIRLI